MDKWREGLKKTDPKRLSKLDRNKILKNKFGISLQKYYEKVESQNGICPICKELLNPGYGNPVDHSHQTGQVRSILHSNCNSMIGFFKEDVNTIKNAIEYLKTNGVIGVDDAK